MSLSSKISQELINEDVPEEIEHDLIKDSVLEIANTNFKVNDEFDELPVGDIRLKLANELSSEYQGKPVSRKSFTQRNWMNDGVELDDELSDDGHITDEIQSDADEGESGEELNEDNLLDEPSDDDTEDKSDADSVQSEEVSESEEEDETSRKGKTDAVVDINIFSSKAKNVDDGIKKGNAIKNQLVLWENLIECRIKLQKGLAASNRLMQKELFAEFQSQLTPEEESNVNATYKGLIELLEHLIKLRQCLLKKCPEYNNFFKKGGSGKIEKGSKNVDSDEEITSESEDENHEEVHSDEETPPEKKRKTTQDYSEYLDELTSAYKPFRDSVIQKWNEKTRLASGKTGISKFAILEQSTLKQIEQILLDRDRLLKRTQTRRSKLPVLGKEKKEMEEELKEEPNEEDDEGIAEQATEKKEELDSEIFDDDDFYHKLLKDFIDRKTSDVTDPTQLGRQWTKLQKLRSKMKKKIDTRATKGRKIRYTVHNKLLNFMAPVPYCTWDDKVEQDLFRSLFGQASQALPAQT